MDPVTYLAKGMTLLANKTLVCLQAAGFHVHETESSWTSFDFILDASVLDRPLPERLPPESVLLTYRGKHLWTPTLCGQCLLEPVLPAEGECVLLFVSELARGTPESP